MRRRVLVIEDDADSASILLAYLEKDGFDVHVAPDGRKGIDAHAQWKPDIVLLDIMLPEVSGIDVLSAIRRTSETPVIMLTALGDEPDKIGALRFGADDYIVKPYSPREVVARVHAVLRRAVQSASTSSNTTFSEGPLIVDTQAVTATVSHPGRDSVTLDLTPTEFGILAMLVKTPFKAFTRMELLEACMPDSDALERVIDTHVHNLRRKLSAEGVSGVLVTVRAVGYRYR
ncbi:response regulator transcription factor [Luteibacter flocculans]|uniref:Response regulator transcription factor n=1 Tax=Luteibacter flocculans TaxID=2780091 RepID=A0ABY4T219_9GAMM|nr:response regulator transcription factor [Luteibacter flocculans]URL58997.1 response regulator transcription factor [Luteibacter flocculans]